MRVCCVLCLSSSVLSRNSDFAQGPATSCFPLTRHFDTTVGAGGGNLTTLEKPQTSDRSLWWCRPVELRGFSSVLYSDVAHCKDYGELDETQLSLDLQTIRNELGAVLVDYGPRFESCSPEVLYSLVSHASINRLGSKFTLATSFGGVRTAFNQMKNFFANYLEELGPFMIHSLAIVDFDPPDAEDVDIEEFLSVMQEIQEWADRRLLPLEFKMTLGKAWAPKATLDQTQRLSRAVAYWHYRSDIVFSECLGARDSALRLQQQLIDMDMAKPTTVSAAWVTHPQEEGASRDKYGRCPTEDGFFDATPERAAIFWFTLGDCDLWNAKGFSMDAGVFSDEQAVGFGLYGNRTESGSVERYVPYVPEICHSVKPTTTASMTADLVERPRDGGGGDQLLAISVLPLIWVLSCC